MCQGSCVGVRRQLCGIDFLILPLYRLQELSSGRHVFKASTLLAE